MMTTVSLAAFRDKVHACWIGKNIGGTMGAPYEGRTDMQDVKGFATKAGEPLPNDDLDLQLVWLLAAEQEGLHGLTAKKLGEYWLSYITPHWNEYGIGKANMKAGLQPPLSGDQDNDWKHSNGAWIRSEIWASIFPGRPDAAALYALEDASVDHGTGEGTYAALFTACMQSAAYVLPDARCCIEVALDKIPADCRVARTVRLAVGCYDGGIPVADARNRIQLSNADIGTGWFEAPSNIGYTVLGLLYGEGDFKKSMITAINCGDDTDCTAATVGATLGILGGTAAIPEDWRAYVGDRIVTISIDRATTWKVPATCGELTDRTVRLAQAAANMPFETRYYHELTESFSFTDGEASPTPTDVDGIKREFSRCPILKERLAELRPCAISTDFTYAHATLSCEGGVRLAPGETKRLHLDVVANTNRVGNIPFRLFLRPWLPQGFTASCPATVFLPGIERHTDGRVGVDLTLTAPTEVTYGTPVRFVLEISAEGRCDVGYLPLTLLT